MRKEEFLKTLRKNLSVLEEREIQDIVEEYEQHIDMKMKEGLSEEAAIKDFGDLKELTNGILEAYHVKADYNTERKNIDFDKVKEESKRATEKATSAIGKGAESVGKWGISQTKKLWNFIKRPFNRLKAAMQAGAKKEQGTGILGKMRFLMRSLLEWMWKFAKWSVRIIWILFWMCFAVFLGLGMLGCIFAFGILIVLLVMGYPVAGVTMIVIGCGLSISAVMLFCITLLKGKSNKRDKKNITKDSDMGDFHVEDKEKTETDWEYPEGKADIQKQVIINSGREVLKHA